MCIVLLKASNHSSTNLYNRISFVTFDSNNEKLYLRHKNLKSRAFRANMFKI